jgi:hypothetical protein
MNHARRNEVELEQLGAYGDRMTGIIAAIIAGDHVRIGGKPVDNPALAFIPPLCTHDNLKWHYFLQRTSEFADRL